MNSPSAAADHKAHKATGVCRLFFGILILFATTTGSEEPAKLFEFHSGMWLNLHHFLRDTARMQALPRGPAIPRTQGDRPKEWTAAVDAYRDLAQRDVLTDPLMRRIKDALEDSENEKRLVTDAIPVEIRDALNAAAPFYRSKFWPDQDRNNRKWIEAVSPLVARFGAPIAARVASVYQAKWPREPVRVDLTNSAGPNGAYTTFPEKGFARVTICSVDDSYSSYHALEMLFHETSHAWGDLLLRKIAHETSAQHCSAPPQLWHLILFYTAGEITRAELDRNGIQDYVPYADVNDHELYSSICPACRDAIATHWQKYLDGKTGIDTAIAETVAATCSPATQPQTH